VLCCGRIPEGFFSKSEDRRKAQAHRLRAKCNAVDRKERRGASVDADGRSTNSWGVIRKQEEAGRKEKEEEELGRDERKGEEDCSKRPLAVRARVKDDIDDGRKRDTTRSASTRASELELTCTL
jgi:hypothetical protein